MIFFNLVAILATSTVRSDEISALGSVFHTASELLFHEYTRIVKLMSILISRYFPAVQYSLTSFKPCAGDKKSISFFLQSTNTWTL